MGRVIVGTIKFSTNTFLSSAFSEECMFQGLLTTETVNNELGVINPSPCL